MRLVTYSAGPAGSARAGVRVGHRVLDIEEASRVKGEPLPSSQKALLAAGRGALSRVQALAKAATTEARSFARSMLEVGAIEMLPPIPDAERILSLEDNYPGPDASPAHDARGASETRSPAAIELAAASLAGHDAKISRPSGKGHQAFGCELVFVIARHASGATDVDPMDYVAGVTILNRWDPQPPRTGKEAAGGASAVGAIGPEIVTMDEIADPYDLWLTVSVNGEERQRVNTGEQIWRLAGLIEHFSRDRPLEPGDLIATGVIRGAGAARPGNAESPLLEPGDVVECSIEGILMLRSTIAPPTEA